jgi:hypothetical protein
MVKVEHYSDRKDICHRLSSGVTPLVRAKALPERMEAPAGLARSGLKPSLSTWKPLRGWRVGYPGHARSWKPAAGLGRRRAEALPERTEAPAGLGRSGLKPSLSAWKSLRGWGAAG